MAKKQDKEEECLADSLPWAEFQASGGQWVGLFDPFLRIEEDIKSLGCIKTVKDCIRCLKKILQYWIVYHQEPAKKYGGARLVRSMTSLIRVRLIDLRRECKEKLPPIPPDLIGILDWIPDAERALAGGTTRNRAEIAQGAIVEATVSNAVDATQGKPDDGGEKKPVETGHKGIARYMSSADLARHHGVDPEALRKRLDRHRAKYALDSDLFVESQDRGRNKPKYLYDAEKVLPIIQELKRQGASVKHPSKRK